MPAVPPIDIASPSPSITPAASWPSWLADQTFLNNPLLSWLIALGVLVLGFALLTIIRAVLISRMERLAKRSSRTWDDALVDVVKSVRAWLLAPAVVYAASTLLVLPQPVPRVLQIAAVLGLSVQLISSSRRLIDFALELLVGQIRTPDGSPDPTLSSGMGVLRFVAFSLLVVLVVLLALDNLGVQITPLITGLGIGGIAIALAVQSILSDLFSSVTIILDKPFVVGDFIVVGNEMGTVERIGIKTTRVRALSGEQLVFPNSDLLGSRVQNFKRMQQRRVVFSFGIIYETPAPLLKRVPGIVRGVVESQSDVRFDRCHFKSFGEYALDFEVVYFVLSGDFNTHMDILQQINLGLFELFEREGVQFAYPTAVEIQRKDLPGSVAREAGQAS